MLPVIPIGDDGVGLADYITSRVSYVLLVMFSLIMLLVVINSIIVAYKFIVSQGEKEKTDRAKRGLRAIFEGVIGFFLAIAGIVFIFTFFGAGLPEASLAQTCISSPGSAGCKQCQVSIDSDLCQFCETQYRRLADKEITLIELSSQTDGVFTGNQCI